MEGALNTMLDILLFMPVPPMAAVVVPQVAPELLKQGPGYLATAILGGWVVLWFLDRIGKLPGRPAGERRSASFTAADRDQMNDIAERTHDIHKLLAFRDDQDGIERLLKFMQDARRSHSTLEHMSLTLVEIRQLLQQQGRRP